MEDFREWRSVEKYCNTDTSIALSLHYNHQIDTVYRDLWSHNIVAAMEKKLPFISDLYGTKKGPVIVCGAGPSLRSNEKQIQRAKEKGWGIVCTDRALKTVRDMGVKEDFSVTTECQPECGDFLDAAGKDDMVVVNLISCPETRDTLIERGASVYHCAPMNPVSMLWNWVYSKDFLGDNVACNRSHIVVTFSAVDICYWMGYGPIITVGNDLCYDDPFSCVEDSALILPNTKRVYPVFDDPFSCVDNTPMRSDPKTKWIRRHESGKWIHASIDEMWKSGGKWKTIKYVVKNLLRLRYITDGGSGYICKLNNGRWSFATFIEAANGFLLYYEWHPKEKGKFIDASGGIATWTKINLSDFLDIYDVLQNTKQEEGE